MTVPMLAEILRLVIPIWSEPSEKELKLSNEKSSLQITNYSVTIDYTTTKNVATQPYQIMLLSVYFILIEFQDFYLLLGINFS